MSSYVADLNLFLEEGSDSTKSKSVDAKLLPNLEQLSVHVAAVKSFILAKPTPTKIIKGTMHCSIRSLRTLETARFMKEGTYT